MSQFKAILELKICDCIYLGNVTYLMRQNIHQSILIRLKVLNLNYSLSLPSLNGCQENYIFSYFCHIKTQKISDFDIIET
jgi:hypothetical protein